LTGIKHNSQILETRMYKKGEETAEYVFIHLKPKPYSGSRWVRSEDLRKLKGVQQLHVNLHYDSLHLRRVPQTHCYCFLRFLPFLTLTPCFCYYPIFFCQNPLSLILFFLRCLIFLFYNLLSFSVFLFVFLNLMS